MHETNSHSSVYHGTFFHPQIPEERTFVSLRIVGERFLFRNEKYFWEYSVQSFKFSWGGAHQRLLMLTHQTEPRIVFYTDQWELLKHPLFKRPEFASLVENLKHKKLQQKLVFWGILLSIALIFLGGIWLLASSASPLVRYTAHAIPISVEQRLGKGIVTLLEPQFDFINNKQILDEFKNIIAPLEKVFPRSWSFSWYVSAKKDVNAFALPGGHVVVLSGLILEAESCEEVLGVVAHEVAHVTERHVMQNLVSSLGTAAFFSMLFGDISGAGLEITRAVLQRKMSRDFEREADARAVEYLIAAGINPQGMVRFFQRMEEKEHRRLQAQKSQSQSSQQSSSSASNSSQNEKGGEDWSDFTANRMKHIETLLSTHPEHQERIQNILAAAGKSANVYKPIECRLKEFQDLLKRLP